MILDTTKQCVPCIPPPPVFAREKSKREREADDNSGGGRVAVQRNKEGERTRERRNVATEKMPWNIVQRCWIEKRYTSQSYIFRNVCLILSTSVCVLQTNVSDQQQCDVAQFKVPSQQTTLQLIQIRVECRHIAYVYDRRLGDNPDASYHYHG